MEDLNTKFCTRPWDFFTIGQRKVHSCCWQLIRSSISDDDLTGSFDIMKHWNDPNIVALREGVLNGTFSMCNKKTCFLIHENKLSTKSEIVKYSPWNEIINNHVTVMDSIPDHVHFEADPSCNLRCPMCRNGHIGRNITDDAFGEKFLTGLYELAVKHKKPLLVSMCGSGEPLYSIPCRNFIFNNDFTDKPYIRIGFNTNGLILTPKTWEMMKNVRNNICYINWSIEGSTEEVYNKCRVGGNFKQVLKNIDFIYSELPKYKNIQLELMYVVHDDNYKDLANFIQLSQYRWPGIRVVFQRYQNCNVAADKRLDVFNKDHPNHLDFLNELENPIFKSSINVSMSNITPFMK
jgi:hypothetical protein